MREKILLIAEDEPSNVELIQLIVERLELPVVCIVATNGLEAVAQAQDRAPDLILMDLRMPVLDGWEAARRLKADPRTAGIPIVALTAQALTEDQALAVDAGCDAYMSKPFDIHALLALLRERLG